MGDHFVLLVDRLLTESTLEAAIESQNRSMAATSSADDEMKNDLPSSRKDFGDLSSLGKLVECRICHDEDEDSNMETPCSCCGSLKYAHRRCVQRWCNEKGNIICEICLQQFQPGYTAPPPLFQIGQIPMNFRGNWEISRRDPNSPRFIAMVSTDNDFPDLQSDEYSTSPARSFLSCHSFTTIFMFLLILRHALPLIGSNDHVYFFPPFLNILLRAAGIILPLYVITRAVIAFRRRHRRQEPPRSSGAAQSSAVQPQPQPHFIRFH